MKDLPYKLQALSALWRNNITPQVKYDYLVILINCSYLVNEFIDVFTCYF